MDMPAWRARLACAPETTAPGHIPPMILTHDRDTTPWSGADGVVTWDSCPSDPLPIPPNDKRRALSGGEDRVETSASVSWQGQTRLETKKALQN